MSDEKTYASPTTPGLMVTFTNFLVELVCLNKQRRLPARFWKLPDWHKRYANEIRGVLRWAKLHEDELENPLYRKAVIAAMRWVQPLTMMSNRNHEKLDRRTAKEYRQLLEARDQMAAKAPPPVESPDKYARDNSKVVVTGERTQLSLIQEIEAHG